MTKHKPLPAREDLLEHLRYDPETGLLWRVGKSFRWSSGEPAGWKHYHYRDGEPAAINIRLKGKVYMAHRLIWRIKTGDDPGVLTIDHINRDPFDNRWENLRLADNSLQMRNRRIYGSSAYKGVCFCNTNKKWKAYTYTEGKYKHLGSFDSEAEAAAAASPYHAQ